MSTEFEVRDRRILTIATVIAGSGLALALVPGVAGFITAFTEGVPVQAHTDVGQPEYFQGTVLIHDPSWLLLTVHLLAVLVAVAGQFLVCLAVLGLVTAARRGWTFLPYMRRALVVVGLGIVLWTVGADLLPGVTSMLADSVMPAGFEFFATISLTPLFVVAVLGVIAAVFDVGARLRHDTEGLV